MGELTRELPQWSFFGLEPLSVEAVVQILSWGCVMTLAVSVSTCTGIGAAVVMVICIEVLHAITPMLDDSMMAIFTAILVLEVTTAPANTVILWRSACWPLVAVSGVIWMVAEVCGYEVMVNTDVALLKRFLGVCLVLVLAMNHAMPLLSGRKHGGKQRTSPKAHEPSGSARRNRMYLTPVSLGKGQSVAVPTDDLDSKHESANSPPAVVDESDWEVDSCLSEVGPQNAQQPTPDELVESIEFSLRTPREWCLAIFLGLLGGFLRGTCGATILALVSFVLWSKIPKDQWRATSPALTTVGLPVRLYYFLVVKEKFEPSRWPQMTGTLVGCLIGVPLGHALSKRVNQADFLDFINFVVIVGAMLLVTDGLKVSIPLGISTAGTWLVCYAILRMRRKAKGRGHVDRSPESSCDADDAA